MIQIWVQNILRFIVLVLIQVLVLNNIQFLGTINPYIYILFILSLPLNTKRWAVLISAFILGLTIDAFSNTLGLHASASVLIAYLRNPFAKAFTTIDDNINSTPSFASFGISGYIKYCVLLVLIHHLTLYFLEAFTLAHFWLTMSRALISSLITILIILGIQLARRK